MKCRHCAAALNLTMIDLGSAPPSNAYLTAETLQTPEKYYPLRVLVCTHCWLAQTEDYTQAEDLFIPDYAYFSSTSSGWLSHAAKYAELMTHRLSLNEKSLVIEVASNDGYLLKNFVAAGIPCLGIEPTASTAAAAESLGVPVLREFFGEKLGQHLAEAGRRADLISGNNVYAHVPNINDFTLGLKAALKPEGTITLEFPHLMQLLMHVQFDTIYHEHFSYLSLFTVERIFESAGLRVYDVEQLPTHGGSLRIYGCHAENAKPMSPAVVSLRNDEALHGLRDEAVYRQFQPKADKIKDDLLMFLIGQKRAGKTVVAYGAAAKGNTLLNYAGVKPDLLPIVCDAAVAKQGKFMPGSHIPIESPKILNEIVPDYLVILPWNIAAEVKKQNMFLGAQGTQFVTMIPSLDIS